MVIDEVREARTRIEMFQAVAAQVRSERMSSENASYDERAWAAIRSQAAKLREGHADFYA